MGAAMPNRYLCDVLEELRDITKTQNYSYMPGLIEEAQVYANRMEAAISDIHDIHAKQAELTRLRKDVRALREARDELAAEVNELDTKAEKLAGEERQPLIGFDTGGHCDEEDEGYDYDED
jgi:polyhydroxyalkanoate synthesis regulator phasin